MNWYIFLPSVYLLLLALIIAFFQGANDGREDE